MPPAPLSIVTIVGGGTAGWMTAATLANHYTGTGLTIRLIESSDIGSIGVGEATIPTIRAFYQSLGLTDAEIVRDTNATIKLGIGFIDWYKKGQSFIHPFAGYGQDFGDIAFHQVAAHMRDTGEALNLSDYSLCVALAEAGKFALPPNPPPFYGAHFDWALHIDAGKFAERLRRHAEALGVERIDAKIETVTLNPETGFIDCVNLNTGQSVGGDLFIDCSGFQGLLIEKALGVSYESYAQWLFCDRAYAVQSTSKTIDTPYTKVTARDAGWQWRIPLQHRAGNGHVYASRYSDDQSALDTLTQNIPDPLLTEPRQIRFTPGRRQQAWVKNCVAIGLSSGFLEPLESTSIALIQTGIEKLKQLFPRKDFAPSLRDEYNDMSRREFERVRDFILLHYKASARDDTAFWRDCQTADLPDSLKHKIELYRSRGHFVRYRWEMFHSQSWLAIYDGFDIHPEAADPAAARLDPAQVRAACTQMRDFITKTVARAPRHADFIDYCHQAAAPKTPVSA